jgi:hypothetical protein
VGVHRRVEPEVLDPVVRLIPVDVVHALATSQTPAEVLLHHPAMLEHGDLTVSAPDLSDHVSVVVERSRDKAGLAAAKTFATAAAEPCSGASKCWGELPSAVGAVSDHSVVFGFCVGGVGRWCAHAEGVG